jgi:hypothetical protein
MLQRLSIAALACALVGCGGGGGADSASQPVSSAPAQSAPPFSALTFNPATASGTSVSGEGLTIQLDAIVNRPSDFPNGGTIYNQTYDAGRVFDGGSSLQTSANGLRYTFHIAASLAAGNYQGTMVLRLCKDEACTVQLPGSPVQLPYQVVVLPGPATP